MAQTTKRALAASLKKLLAAKPMDNITVKDLVENCEVSRQTFYYHFQDIYDLLQWVFEQEAEALLAGKKDTDTWQEGFLETFRYVQRNRAMVLHVYHSNGRPHLDACLDVLVHDLLCHVVEENCADLEVAAENKVFLADFYKFAFLGLMQDWIARDMKEAPEALVEKTATLLEGDFRRGLEKLSV
ncbi:MAG: TetR family transcriptional regulator [Clostridia bacterium]|nr:TetR family transcriptional regulator [Clostridia bacterium]